MSLLGAPSRTAGHSALAGTFRIKLWTRDFKLDKENNGRNMQMNWEKREDLLVSLH